MLAVLLSAAVAGLAGCGPSIPKTYPVKGKVVLKGGKLTAGTHIIFESKGNSEIRADGTVQDDGSFTVATKMYGKQKDGAVEGEHRVMIIEPKGTTGFVKSRMITASKPVKVEPRDNDLTIEAQTFGP
jgi:hypothetical protein